MKESSPRHQSHFTIAAENFEKVLKTLPSDHAETLRWWYFLGKERGWSMGQLAHATGVSTTTLSRVFRGVYNADLTSMCETLEKARINFREAIDNPDFIVTSLSKQMFRLFDRTRALANVTIMWGPMGIGKTAVSEEYKIQNNHGKTGYVRCGSGLTFASFIYHVARSLGVSVSNAGLFITREKIISVMSAGQRLLIIDELHQVFLTTRGATAVKICEFLREIHDRAKCGLVLIGTNVIHTEIFKGNHREALAQLVDRGTTQVPLPEKPTKQDITAFFSHYGLPLPGADDPEAAEILRDIVTAHGLRKLTLHLRDGAANAARLTQKYNLSHFVAAYDDLASLCKPRNR